MSNQRFLHTLPPTLSKSQLFAKQVRALLRRLGEIVGQSLGELRSKALRDGVDLRETHTVLRDVSVGLLCHEATGDLRITTTPELLAAINDSFERKAPPYCRWMLVMTKGVKKAIQGAGRGLNWLLDQIPFVGPLVGVLSRFGRRIMATLYNKLREVLNQDEEAVQLTAEGLSRKLHAHGVGMKADQTLFSRACDTVIERFQASLGTLQIDQTELDAVMVGVWEKVGWGRRALLFVYSMGMLLLALLLLMLVPLDGGGTSVAVITLQGLGANVLGSLGFVSHLGIAVFISGILLPAIAPMIEKQVALPLLANFFAITCDVFGIRRRFGDDEIEFNVGGKKRTLPVARAAQQPTVCPLLNAREWVIEEKLASELEALIRRDDEDASQN